MTSSNILSGEEEKVLSKLRNMDLHLVVIEPEDLPMLNNDAEIIVLDVEASKYAFLPVPMVGNYGFRILSGAISEAAFKWNVYRSAKSWYSKTEIRERIEARNMVS